MMHSTQPYRHHHIVFDTTRECFLQERMAREAKYTEMGKEDDELLRQIEGLHAAQHFSKHCLESFTNIVLAVPRPRRMVECSDAWQARVAAWSSALATPTGVCISEAERPQATAIDGPASASLPLTTSELANTGPSAHIEGNEPKSLGLRPVNLRGPTFPDIYNNIIGDVQALPSIEDGIPAIITLPYALDIIRKVKSPSTLSRATRVVIYLLSQEHAELRRKEIENGFREEVIGLVQKSFSGKSSLCFLSDEDFIAWQAGEPDIIYDARQEQDSIKALSLCTLLCGLIRIKAMPSSDLELAIQILYSNRRVRGHKAIIYHLLKVGSQFTYPILTVTNLAKIGVSMSVDDRISRDIFQLILQYRLNNVSR